MNAIRLYGEVRNHEITVKLPATFQAGKVEIIIIPFEKYTGPAQVKEEFNKLQSILLAAPDMGDEELRLILQKRKALNQWN